MAKIVKNNLGYLGVDFQYKLIAAFIERPKFFKDLYPIIDQNMFTESYLKTIVGVMKEYYAKYDVTASYDIISIKLRDKAYTTDDIQYFDEAIEKLRNLSTEGIDEVEEMAEKFFKQQNWIRIANEIRRVAGDGDMSKYDECEKMIQEANSIGRKTIDMASPVDSINEDLSKENIISIPTGIEKLDNCLGGGLDKGKIGLIMAAMGSGKAQPLTSKVLTPDGFKTIGDMKVGSEIIGYDSKVHKVIGVFPQGIRPVYKLTFSDGSVVECDIDHLWNVIPSRQRHNKHNNMFSTLSLCEIIEQGIHKVSKKGIVSNVFKVPKAKKIEINEQKLPIDPYTFGCSVKSNNEPIPEIYKVNSIENRVSLLQGLLDTDGYVCKNGSIEFITKNKQIAEDVKFISQSLGAYVSITPKNEEYCVHVRFTDETIKPFRLKEKMDGVSYKTKYGGIMVYITNIEYMRDDYTQCILVDSDEHLYITDNFIVTHNTSITTAFSAAAATYKCKQNNFKGYKMLHIVFEDTRRDINRKYFGRLTQIETKDINKDNETTETVRKLLKNHPDLELIKNNIRVVHLDTGKYSASDIIHVVKKIINEGFKPDGIVTDYFECVIAERGTATMKKWDQETFTMRVFENGAKELNVAWWIPSQGNRGSVSSELITMDQGSGSIGKQQVAQVVMSITRSVEDINNQRATIAVLKNRSGSAGIVLQGLRFNNGTCTITCDDVIDFDNPLAYNESVTNENMAKRYGDYI